MGIVFTPYDYETFQLDISSERNIYEKFFISIALNTLYFIKSPLPWFEHKSARILHLKIEKVLQI